MLEERVSKFIGLQADFIAMEIVRQRDDLYFETKNGDDSPHKIIIKQETEQHNEEKLTCPISKNYILIDKFG